MTLVVAARLPDGDFLCGSDGRVCSNGSIIDEAQPKWGRFGSLAIGAAGCSTGCLLLTAAVRQLSKLRTIEEISGACRALLKEAGYEPKPVEGSNPVFNVAALIIHNGELYRADSGDFHPQRTLGCDAMWAIGSEWSGAVMTYRALRAEGVLPGRALRRVMAEAMRVSLYVGGRQQWFNMPGRKRSRKS